MEVALERTLDAILAAQADVLVVAGDIFDSIRPPNRAILFLFKQLGRVRAAAPAMPIIVVAGNHDSPRSSDAGVILPLYAALGVTVVQHAVQQVPLSGATVTAVPSAAVRELRALQSGGDGAHLLVAHAEAHGPSPEFEPAALGAWAYAAFGHYHVATRLADRAWYSGSIEYVSTDPWSELEAEAGRGKGWLLADTQAGTVQWQPVAAPRAFYDLGTVDGTDCSAAEVDARIAAALAGPLDGAVARLQVCGVTRATQHALDYGAIRAHKARALHLQLTFARVLPPTLASVVGLPKRLPRLEELVAAFFADRTLPPDVDRAALVRAAQGYLKESP